MEINLNSSEQTNNKHHLINIPLLPCKRTRGITQNTAILHIKLFSLPLISTSTNSPCESIHLKPDKPYTIGRDHRRCEFVFTDSKVSSVHCQLLFNSLKKRVYISDGVGFSFGECTSRVRGSLNEVYVNGEKISGGAISELEAGDEVSLVCWNERNCGMGVRIGFLVDKIIFVEEVVAMKGSEVDGSSMPLNCIFVSSECESRANVLLSMCRGILCSNNPVSYIQKCVSVNHEERINNCNRNGGSKTYQLFQCSHLQFPVIDALDEDGHLQFDGREFPPDGGFDTCRVPESESRGKDDGLSDKNSELLCCNDISGKDNEPANECHEEAAVASERNIELNSCNGIGKNIEIVSGCQNELQLFERTREFHNISVTSDDKAGACSFTGYEQTSGAQDFEQATSTREPIPAPGKRFFLNRLLFMDYPSNTQDVISLPELLYPIESLQRVFIATFTSDVRWFLSYCEIPADLPVTIACHNAERCWSSSPDKRTSIPYSDYPNVVLVYPPFPEVIAFGQDRRKLGIACHHPKLFLLLRENSIRVVITSANLVAKQWQHVTNTVWWQDFPRSSAVDYFPLFAQLSDGENNQDTKCDFAAQLAGYVASLIADIPGQAYWIQELTKFDFKGAVGYLVASVPGIYSSRSPYISDSRFFLGGGPNLPKSLDAKLLGSVEASVVGVSHLFRTSVDADGSRIKKLAGFLGKCHENVHGMSEVVLRRDRNIPADSNAVSVLVPGPEEYSLEDCVQLGFLPRHIAKWVAPLSDIGLFAFSAYVYPKVLLATAFEGSNLKVQLILYVSEGPLFSCISEIMQTEHVAALSSLLASIQRCSGLWRLQEVLSLFKWPEHLETEFVFGSSSIGAVNAHFLAAFSAAAGKRSLKFIESEESDPDWGCWSASQELRNPSIRIIFPTIERVKNTASGILASKYILCFSKKTWQRLKRIGILHDAVPYPNNRVGLPMHVKVARRRFQSDSASSFGWVYCGSHNFSAAAWGRPLSNSIDKQAARDEKKKSVLGSKLHVSNYELGILFVVHPSDKEGNPHQGNMNLDEIVLPFVVPAPKYSLRDRPATRQAMWEALTELSMREREICEAVAAAGGWIDEEVPVEEDEVVEADVSIITEKEDEKAYAETLWSQVDSSQSS